MVVVVVAAAAAVVVFVVIAVVAGVASTSAGVVLHLFSLLLRLPLPGCLILLSLFLLWANTMMSSSSNHVLHS